MSHFAAPGTQKFAAINGTTGDVAVVAAVTDKKIRVLSFCLVPGAVTQTLRFESGAGGTALTGIMLASDDGAAGPRTIEAAFSEAGHFETVAGEALSLEVTGGDVDGWLVYQEVA